MTLTGNNVMTLTGNNVMTLRKLSAKVTAEKGILPP